ncbi:MAG: DUF2764 family protein [Candidatus Omnitrophota bacterium]|nr:DUF2764 family protein [Candidatus Omnitrophota bacterium]
MAQFYVYFISSLPMLHYGMRPPFTFERFLESAGTLIGEKDRVFLENLPAHIDEYGPKVANSTVKAWLDFDTALRNELARIRGHSKKIEAVKFLRPVTVHAADIAFVAASAHRHPHILEAEGILDAARWAKLDELNFGHYFDLDALIIYAYKLKILERWDKINTADKEGLLENAEAHG